MLSTHRSRCSARTPNKIWQTGPRLLFLAWLTSGKLLIMKILREVALTGSLINFFILKLITFQSILNHVFRPVRSYGGSQKFKITKQQILTYKITDKQTDTNTFWWSNCTQALFSGWVKKKHRTKITNTTLQ